MACTWFTYSCSPEVIGSLPQLNIPGLDIIHNKPLWQGAVDSHERSEILMCTELHAVYSDPRPQTEMAVSLCVYVPSPFGGVCAWGYCLYTHREPRIVRSLACTLAPVPARGPHCELRSPAPRASLSLPWCALRSLARCFRYRRYATQQKLCMCV